MQHGYVTRSQGKRCPRSRGNILPSMEPKNKHNRRFRLISAVCILLLPGTASAFEKSWDDYMEAGRQALQQRRYAEAETQFKFALKEAEKFEEPDARRASSLHSLANAYHSQKKYSEAGQLFQRVLELQQKALGPEDLSVGRVLHNLAKVYSEQAKHVEAEQAYKRAVAIFEKHYGAEHSRAAALTNFADAYVKQRKYAEAERLYEQVLEILGKEQAPEKTPVARDGRGLAQNRLGSPTAVGSSPQSPTLVAQADRTEESRQTPAVSAEQQGDRQIFNVLDRSFEIPARGWELLAETETGVQLILKHGDRRGESISIDRVLFPPRLGNLSREQHASNFFQMERRKRRPQGVAWQGFTEGARRIGGQVYTIMTFHVTYPPNAGVKQTGLFLVYFPEDFKEKNRFFSLTWTDTHPANEASRGLTEFDAFVSGLRIRPVSAGGAARQGYRAAESQAGALIRAVREGRTDDVKAMLDSGADPNAIVGGGVGGLVLAVIDGHSEIVQALLEHGGDPNTKAGDGVTTVLMQASSIGHTEIVHSLLAAGANVNARGNSGLTALQLAASKGHVPAVRGLLTYGAAIELPVFLAAKVGGHAGILKNGLAPNRPAGLETELIRVVFEGTVDRVETLLAEGADPNDTKDASGTTALTRALKLWQLGLQRDALPLQVRAVMTGRDQPGAFAATKAYKRIVSLLKQKNAESTYVDLYLFGHLSDQQGRHEKALESFRGATGLNPDFAEGYRRMGITLTRLERHEEALQAFREAVRLRPNSARDHHHIGFALASLGRYDEAVEPYQEAIRLRPDFPQAAKDLVAALKRLGRKREADSYARRAEEGNLTRIKDTGRRYELPGFSVFPPKGKKWSVRREGNRFMFVRDAGSGRRSVVAVAQSRFLELKLAALNVEQLLATIERLAGHRPENDGRYRVLDQSVSRVSQDSAKGGACVKKEFTSEDHAVPNAPGEVFILTGGDYYCFHPETSKPLLVQISYSQRYPKGKKPLPIESELEPFVGSLSFPPVR